MTILTDFDITKRWPATDPDVIQLYSLTTPNGVKASIMLEETGLPYEAHYVDFAQADQETPEFLSLNPNNKIPAIVDPNGPDGTAMGLFESGAILICLADKSGKLLPKDGAKRYETLQWLMWQMGGIGPMFGQLGFFFKYAGAKFEDKRPQQRFVDESIRLLEVLDQQLEGRDWVTGDYSIADIAIAPWLDALVGFYGAADLVEWQDLDNVPAYLARFLARPAVKRGMVVPARP
ncbi:MAG: glutathione S-transferase [Alphaproteobacteria bacterium]|nr:glutathione S-transferase [Alphaproteobacteria bacterium]